MSASYPNAVKNFPTRNSGDVITAAFFNEPQDEITAIEQGITQGTAPLNSSNSTVANLSVLGNSTIAGNLTVTGTITHAGADVFSSHVTANAQPRCKVTKGSTQSVPNITWTALTFDGQDFNVGSMHSTATDPSRITIQSTGIWMFGATVASTTTSQSNFLSFRKNGATFIATRNKGVSNSSGTELLHHTVIEQLTSTGDYVECMVFQNSGGALEFGTGSSSRVDKPEFWAVKLW